MCPVCGLKGLFTTTYLFTPEGKRKMLFRAILCGGVLHGFLLGQANKDDVPCQFCGKKRWRWSFVLGMHLSTFVACSGTP